jgi:hypothetical protein
MFRLWWSHVRVVGLKGFYIQCVRKVAVRLGYGTLRYIDLVISIEVAVEVIMLFLLTMGISIEGGVVCCWIRLFEKAVDTPF